MVNIVFIRLCHSNFPCYFFPRKLLQAGWRLNLYNIRGSKCLNIQANRVEIIYVSEVPAYMHRYIYCRPSLLGENFYCQVKTDLLSLLIVDS